MFQKHLHYSQEIEAAVLGVCLLEKTAFPRIYGLIDQEVFYSDGNGKIFQAMKQMFEKGAPIDLYTVLDWILNRMKIKQLDESDQELIPYHLTRLTNNVVSGASIEYHAMILKRMWMERKILNLTMGGVKLKGNIREQIGQLYLELQEITNQQNQNDWQDMSELIMGLYRHMDQVTKGNGIGIPTGVRMLDKENGGLYPGQMVIIGARPSVGKSAFAGQMAVSMAEKGLSVGILSMEMDNTETAARISALDSDTDFGLIYRNLLREEKQRNKVYERLNKHTANLPIYVCDRVGINVNEIRAMATKLKAKKKLDCLMIDYLQLVSSETLKNRSRENEVSEISRGIKIMAKELAIPVIALCQLSREITRRKGADRYPHLSDLRESGSLEQDADVVMFLHRDYMLGEQYMTNENGQSTEREADLIVRKWRNGAPNLHIKFDFDPPKMKFSERRGLMKIAPEDYEAPKLPYADKDDLF